MRGLDKSHCSTSFRTNSECVLLISLKAFPTDFRRYSLSCALCLTIRAIATDGFSLKNGRLVQILNPSVTARITFGLLSFSHSSMRDKETPSPLCIRKLHRKPLQVFPARANFYQYLLVLSENKVHHYSSQPISPI